MVGRVLTGNGITRCERGTHPLVGGEELSDAFTWPKASVAEPLSDQLLRLCRQRLDAFLTRTPIRGRLLPLQCR